MYGFLPFLIMTELSQNTEMQQDIDVRILESSSAGVRRIKAVIGSETV